MSVAAVLEVRRRAFPGYNDPSLPQWIWVGQVVVVGDASGGDRSGSIILATAAGPKVSLLWSLEQMSILDSDNNSKDMDLTFLGTDELLGTQVMRISIGAGVTTASIPAQNYPRMPFYIGAHQAQGAAAALLLTAANVNTAVMAFTAQGYCWGSRSRSIPGGPQRPLQGLYAA